MGNGSEQKTDCSLFRQFGNATYLKAILWGILFSTLFIFVCKIPHLRSEMHLSQETAILPIIGNTDNMRNSYHMCGAVG